jgi:hypothetical protein
MRPMKCVPGLASVFLTLLSMGCAAQREKPLVRQLPPVEVVSTKVLDLPAHLTAPCEVAPLPSHGTDSITLAVDSATRFVAQVVCNERFPAIIQFIEDAKREIAKHERNRSNPD